MTEKLYYQDSHIKEFTSPALSCIPCEKGYEVILARTAFFPEGGGQPCDTGHIGAASVIDVFDIGKIGTNVFHHLIRRVTKSYSKEERKTSMSHLTRDHLAYYRLMITVQSTVR